MGAIYDRRMIQAQIKGVVDAGLTTGYMMWNPQTDIHWKSTKTSDIHLLRLRPAHSGTPSGH